MTESSIAFEGVLRGLYCLLAQIGRPFGGIRPHRILNRLRQFAWRTIPQPGQFRYIKDAWGCNLRLHPYYHIDHEIITTGTYDKALHRFIERNVQPGMTVIDVGANIGSTTLHLSKKVGKKGTIVSFEPVPHLVARLKENVAANPFATNITVEECGVWSCDGISEINVPNLLSDNHGRATMVGSHPTFTRESIATVALDSYVSKGKLGHIDIIKLDIQGAEVMAIEGAAALLHQWRPVLLTEVSPNDLAAFGSSSRRYIQQLQSKGYICHLLTKQGTVGEAVRLETMPEQAHFSNLVCIAGPNSLRTVATPSTA